MKTYSKIAALLIIAVMMVSCTQEDDMMNEDLHKTYAVKRLVEPITIDADWNKPQWQDAEAIEIGLYMGQKPEHIPNVQAKIAYDDDNIFVIFKVEDNYIKALAENHQDRVCGDSCVEFFFTPSSDIADGYMNVETNCCGKILFRYQKQRDVGMVPVSLEDIDKIEIAHSLPGEKITEEIQTPTTWTIEYRLPYSIIEKYTEFVKPERGVMWWANLYKCADQTSKPHWLTWSLVDKPEPDFHRPEYFGTLVFE